ncbi:DNA-3-methyladenine glycosylase family protein [Kineococcus gynurae]|uniref:DNA-3-methyladenine glycosylase II n=1 Tax=Kineococcus gynurae TaxID=452979 RepID=A0ABV5LPV5_9ACTN
MTRPWTLTTGLAEGVPPLAVDPLHRFLAAHALPGAERVEPATPEAPGGPDRPELVRVLPTAAGPTVVGVTLRPEAVTVRRIAGSGSRGDVEARVRRWLDLDADPRAAVAALGADPLLADAVRARPGLRIPRTPDPVETTVMTVLGQQVSLGAARTFGGRLVAAYGVPAGAGLTAFPTAAALAAAGPDALRATTGVTGARGRTLHALATLLADGLDLDAARESGSTEEAYRALLALPGVGPWTADYVSLRVLGRTDVFLPSDLVARRALGGLDVKAATARVAGWSPWRGYGLLHLWTAAVFA